MKIAVIHPTHRDAAELAKEREADILHTVQHPQNLIGRRFDRIYVDARVAARDNQKVLLQLRRTREDLASARLDLRRTLDLLDGSEQRVRIAHSALDAANAILTRLDRQ